MRSQPPVPEPPDLPIRARAEFARDHAADLLDHISIVYGALKLFRELGDQLMTARCLTPTSPVTRTSRGTIRLHQPWPRAR